MRASSLQTQCVRDRNRSRISARIAASMVTLYAGLASSNRFVFSALSLAQPAFGLSEGQADLTVVAWGQAGSAGLSPWVANLKSEGSAGSLWLSTGTTEPDRNAIRTLAPGRTVSAEEPGAYLPGADRSARSLGPRSGRGARLYLPRIRRDRAGFRRAGPSSARKEPMSERT